MTNVLITGSNGRMGRLSVAAIEAAPDLKLVATVASSEQDLAAIIKSTKPDVLLDFTMPGATFNIVSTAIECNVRPVIGTSGLSDSQVNTLKNHCNEKKLGGILVPNFSLCAVLMMQFAQQASQYLGRAEIIEMHHEQKLDAPSGTASYTRKLLGGDAPIHSIRLPGVISHQKVMFGTEGETLTISYDGIDRQHMLKGVLLACRGVVNLSEFVVGLEHVFAEEKTL